MSHKGQGFRQRLAEAKRKEKRATKRLRRLARRKAKREQPLVMNKESDSVELL